MSGPNPPGREPDEPESEPVSDTGDERASGNHLPPVAGGGDKLPSDQTGETDAYSRAYSAPESEHVTGGPYVPADLRLYDYDDYEESSDLDDELAAPRWPWVVGVAAIIAAVALVVSVSLLVTRPHTSKLATGDTTSSAPPVQDEITTTKPAPVLIFVPGGAWVHGSRAIQGYAVLSRLAAQGWVCLSIDYRVAPHHRWPRHILDVKTAIAWARANVDKFGGDRNFIAVAGCSAGGHLSALAGLTANDPQYQAELPEGSDTSVDAVVGIYGRYDWEDRSTPERARFVDFLERVVVQRTIDRHPEVFRDASPIQRVTRNAPPFLVIHGSRDCVIPVEQARSFVERLRAVSRSQVGYLELPGAGHGFDLLDGARTGPTAHAIALFLNQVHRSRAQFAKEVI